MDIIIHPAFTWGRFGTGFGGLSSTLTFVKKDNSSMLWKFIQKYRMKNVFVVQFPYYVDFSIFLGSALLYQRVCHSVRQGVTLIFWFGLKNRKVLVILNRIMVKKIKINLKTVFYIANAFLHHAVCPTQSHLCLKMAK